MIVLSAIAWNLFLANGGQPPVPNLPGYPQNDPLTTAMMLLSAAGFIGLVFSLVNVILGTRIGQRQMRDQARGRIVQRALAAQAAGSEKAKRVVRLTDDGEMETVDDTVTEAAETLSGTMGQDTTRQ